MQTLFISIRILDVVDILIVSYLMYQFYMLIKGTAAINIFVGIFLVYVTWLIVKALNMQLLGAIMGQVIGVGVIALLILFQQEIRRFLLLIGTRYFKRGTSSFERFFALHDDEKTAGVRIHAIYEACASMASVKTGALIVVARQSRLLMYTETGEIINAETTQHLLESIFFKNNPLHDGAVIIADDKILAARVVLPISENPNLPEKLGTRHRAALGITEHTDAIAIVVSEETGHISVAENGKLTLEIEPIALVGILQSRFAQYAVS
jgi:diadenylate cyclase